jgi:hypothetical protein
MSDGEPEIPASDTQPIPISSPSSSTDTDNPPPLLVPRPRVHEINRSDSHRFALSTRRPPHYGGGTCTILVRHVSGHVELLFHADPRTGSIMTPTQASDIAHALTQAAKACDTNH